MTVASDVGTTERVTLLLLLTTTSAVTTGELPPVSTWLPSPPPTVKSLFRLLSLLPPPDIEPGFKGVG